MSFTKYLSLTMVLKMNLMITPIQITQISHKDLSEPNNDMYDGWMFTWSRISQKNNNYPILLFTGRTWGGEEPEKIDDYYAIKKVENLVWIAENVNVKGKNFAGENFKVVPTADNSSDGINVVFDLQHKLWTPI